MDHEWEKILPRLPIQPCDGLQSEILSSIYDECVEGTLGESLILFSRESVEVADRIKQTMAAEDWEAWEHSRRRRWGARCTCSICGEDFFAGWASERAASGKTRLGIRLGEGEDGVLYDGYTDYAPVGTVEYLEGEILSCPLCGAGGVLTRRAALHSGRTCRVLTAEVAAVDDYAALLYWMVTRVQDSTGYDSTSFVPHYALVIDRDGKLHRCKAEVKDGDIVRTQWRAMSSVLDPMQQPYYSHDAEFGRHIGGWVLGYGPDLAGTTAEKTALDEYIGAGGTWPGSYLMLWAKRPQVENLMRQGFAWAVTDAIDTALSQATQLAALKSTPILPWVDWREAKPHRMLHMSREAFRAIRGARWSAGDADCWCRYRTILGSADALEFEDCRGKLGTANVGKLLDVIRDGWSDLTPARVTRYLLKQGRTDGGVQLLIDYRRMALDLAMGETAETLWPRDLQTAHDRVAQAWADLHDLKWEAGFTSTYMTLRELEWTDGELCIVIPKSERELVDEGRVLRHCVGSYARTHCSGKPIFFVRHHRRPERSYYTLNIDLTGMLPREIQLHGYGNERHGANKEYIHSIPRAVRDFVDRWQREVLLPWFAGRQRAARIEAKKKRKLA